MTDDHWLLWTSNGEAREPVDGDEIYCHQGGTPHGFMWGDRGRMCRCVTTGWVIIEKDLPVALLRSRRQIARVALYAVLSRCVAGGGCSFGTYPIPFTGEPAEPHASEGTPSKPGYARKTGRRREHRGTLPQFTVPPHRGSSLLSRS